MKRCNHQDKFGVTAVGQISKQTGEYLGEKCYRCSEWLPIGPSNDKSVAVWIEVAAAALAARESLDDLGLDLGLVPTETAFGMLAYGRDQDPPPDGDVASVWWHLGWLTAAIATHGKPTT